MAVTWRACAEASHNKVAEASAGCRFSNALIETTEQWLKVVSADTSKPEQVAESAYCFFSWLLVTVRLWNDAAYWPTGPHVQIGHRMGNSTASAAMDYFFDVQEALHQGPLANEKVYHNSPLTLKQVKPFQESLSIHFAKEGIPANPGKVLKIRDQIELQINSESLAAAAAQSKASCEQIEHLRKQFLAVDGKPALTDALISGGKITAALHDAGCLPSDVVVADFFRTDKAGTDKNNPLGSTDSSLTDSTYISLVRHYADHYTDNDATGTVCRVASSGNGVIPGQSDPNKDFSLDAKRFTSFCAILIQYLNQPADSDSQLPSNTPKSVVDGELTNASKRRRRAKNWWFGAALAELKKDRNLDDAEIARAIGADKSSLSRSVEWKNIRATIKQQNLESIPIGSKIEGDIEAVQS